MKIVLIKTGLTGKDRSLITTENSITEIRNKLKSGIRGDNPNLLLAKLNKVRLNGKGITQYATEIEKLTQKLQAAYVSEGMPERLAKKYTKGTTIKAVTMNATADATKTIIAAGSFENTQELLSKLVSVEGIVSQQQVLHMKDNRNFCRKSDFNFRNNHRRSTNSGLYNGNPPGRTFRQYNPANVYSRYIDYNKERKFNRNDNYNNDNNNNKRICKIEDEIEEISRQIAQ